jgi:hypothetical protein
MKRHSPSARQRLGGACNMDVYLGDHQAGENGLWESNAFPWPQDGPDSIFSGLVSAGDSF